MSDARKRFCSFCGAELNEGSFLCPSCGRHNEAASQPTIVINNQNVNTNTAIAGGMHGRPRDKWVAFLLCLFLGVLGAHKFYEGKAGMGVLYILTFGLFGIGWLCDLIALLCKPNPYYV